MTTLRPMTDDEYIHWRAQSITGYAAEKVRSGRWSEAESLSEAEKELAGLLPDGLATAGHVLYTIESEAGQSVGALWVARTERPAGPIGYVYDLVVWPAQRRRGYAAAAMQALEVEVARMGWCGLALHVFGHNTPARQLYDRLGFQPTNINLFKALAPRPAT